MTPKQREFKVGVGLYYGVGGNVEATFKFNITKLDFSFEEFEAALGVGFGGKLAGQYIPTMRPRGEVEPETSGSYVLWNKPWGSQQQEAHSIMIGLKGSAELQVGPVMAGLEQRLAVQSALNGTSLPAGASSLVNGGQLQAKAVTGLGLAYQIKADLFNCNYKR